MAKLVFGMNQSLDGYVDHEAFMPDPVLFRHFIDQMGDLTGCLYGRRLYEIMRYWDEDDPNWDGAEREFAEAWRRQPKWVASRTLKSVGPNAILVEEDLATLRAQAEERPYGRDRRGRPGPGGQPCRTRPDRRIPPLSPPGGSGRGQSLLRRSPAAASSSGHASHRCIRDPADVRSRLSRFDRAPERRQRRP